MAFLSCQKDDDPILPTTGTVTFYRTIGGSWNLLIDGQDKGWYAQFLSQPLCGQAGLTTIELSTGSHTYDMKSNDGLAWGDPKEFTVVAGCKVVKTVY